MTASLLSFHTVLAAVLLQTDDSRDGRNSTVIYSEIKVVSPP